MTDNTLSLVFDQVEFEQLCENARLRYIGQYQTNPFDPIKGSIVSYVADSVSEGAELYHELRSKGFTSLDPMNRLQSFNVLTPASGSAGFQPCVQLYMVKPEKEQTEDLEVIYKRVRANYELTLYQRLEAAVAAEQARRAERTRIAELASRALAAQEAYAKSQEEAEKIKQEILQSLTAPAPKAKTKKA